MLRRKIRIAGWYLKKSYPHFDLPLSFEEAAKIVTDPIKVAQKSTWPFIGFVDSKRKFKKIDGEPVVKVKDRPLRYCSHHDGYIHSFYAEQLTKKYETHIKDAAIDDVVIGYRRGLGTNVNMAKSAFDEIRKRGDCAVLAFDIESFFDSIDHKVLKTNLQTILRTHRLPDDWFKIFRSMTRYSWVEIEALAGRLAFDLKDPPRPFCSSVHYRTKVRGDDGSVSSIVNTNTNNFGIPQGSPISAVFSNIYMLGFDLECGKKFKEMDVFYRRYSDDIIVICSKSQRPEVVAYIKGEITKLGSSLKISEDKTATSLFTISPSGSLSCDQPITYLGLTFDGSHVSLRGRTISRYYRRMSYATRHAARDAQRAGTKKIFKRKLYRDLSHLGQHNFYAYAKKAAEILNDVRPVRQLRRHVEILKRKITTYGK